MLNTTPEIIALLMFDHLRVKAMKCFAMAEEAATLDEEPDYGGLDFYQITKMYNEVLPHLGRPTFVRAVTDAMQVPGTPFYQAFGMDSRLVYRAMFPSAGHPLLWDDYDAKKGFLIS